MAWGYKQGCRFVTTRCGAYPTLPPPAFVYASPPAEWAPPVPTDPALSPSLCAGPDFWRRQGSDAQTTILRDKCAAGIDPCSYSPNGSVASGGSWLAARRLPLRLVRLALSGVWR
mmetsp:Transcript_22927/g.73377  ORF Transcript_22927/g.73377 Transcript_22927/m.73377 type:complete len:115 (+) Transcript_22927:3-347(+)